jgi:hypothetical protein
MGGEIVGEFLMSIGYLPGAHGPACPVFERIAKQKPAWMAAAPADRAGTGSGDDDKRARRPRLRRT